MTSNFQNKHEWAGGGETEAGGSEGPCLGLPSCPNSVPQPGAGVPGLSLWGWAKARWEEGQPSAAWLVHVFSLFFLQMNLNLDGH